MCPSILITYKSLFLQENMFQKVLRNYFIFRIKITFNPFRFYTFFFAPGIELTRIAQVLHLYQQLIVFPMATYW